jgi:hypothetical protein
VGVVGAERGGGGRGSKIIERRSSEIFNALGATSGYNYFTLYRVLCGQPIPKHNIRLYTMG